MYMNGVVIIMHGDLLLGSFLLFTILMIVMFQVKKASHLIQASCSSSSMYICYVLLIVIKSFLFYCYEFFSHSNE